MTRARELAPVWGSFVGTIDGGQEIVERAVAWERECACQALFENGVGLEAPAGGSEPLFLTLVNLSWHE